MKCDICQGYLELWHLEKYTTLRCRNETKFVHNFVININYKNEIIMKDMLFDFETEHTDWVNVHFDKNKDPNRSFITIYKGNTEISNFVTKKVFEWSDNIPRRIQTIINFQ